MKTSTLFKGLVGLFVFVLSFPCVGGQYDPHFKPSDDRPIISEEANLYGRVYLNSILEAFDRKDVKIKTEAGLEWRVESASLENAVVYRSGQFVGFTDELIVPQKSALLPLEFKGQYRQENLSALESFETQAPALIKKQGLTMDEFHRWVTEPVDSIPPHILAKIKTVRDAVPFPTRDTLLEKTIPAKDIQKYLDGTYKDIKGYITRAQDTKGLMGYKSRYNTLRLDYQGSPFNDATDDKPKNGS